MASLQIVIDAINNASTEIEGVKTDIEGIGTEIDGVNTSAGASPDFIEMFTGALAVIIAVATTVAGAIKAINEEFEILFEQAQQGVAIQITTDQFGNLAENIGSTADALIVDLRDATKGTISDMDLMKGASMAMSLGLADNSEELSRIASVSANLGQPLDKVTMMLTNVSETSFEKLGINMDGFKEQVAGIQAANEGWTKSQAETEAGLQRLEGQISLMGGALDSEVLSTLQYTAELKNQEDAQSRVAASTMDDVLPSKIEKIQKDIEETQSTLDLKEGYEDFTTAIDTATAANVTQATSTDLLTTGMTAWQNAMDAGQVDAWIYADAMDNLNIMAREGKLGQDGLTASMDLLTIASGGAAGGVQTLNDTPLEDKNSTLTTDDQATPVVENANALQLEDKDATITYGVDDGAVDAYKPPTKTGTVVYSAGGGGGGGGGAMYEAVGGAVYGGNPYTWQEYGYKGELFVPSSDGFVMSRADAERALSKALTGGGAAMDPDAIGKAVAKALSGVTKGNQSGNVYNLTMPTSSNPADVRTAFELMEAWNG